jgi:hypothetical protein
MSAPPHVHRQYGHVRPWRKSLGGVSLSPRGIRRNCRFAGKRIGNVSPSFRQRQTNRNATTVRLKPNPTTPTPALPVLLQKETSISFVSFITHGNAWQYTSVVLTRFRPFIKYDTFYNGDIYQDNARQNTILTVPLFIKFNTFYHNDNYNAWQYTMLTVRS